jgi:bifunctional DNA-binding transcriptional regulator/antitoxin component of YhaV-PrlF toxin-antitoxin module
MATLQYRAIVEPNGRLLLPQEAQTALDLKPGDEITISFDRVEASVLPEASPRNEGMLKVLADIEKHQEGRRSISGEETQRMLREARAGGMYGFDPTE